MVYIVLGMLLCVALPILPASWYFAAPRRPERSDGQPTPETVPGDDPMKRLSLRKSYQWINYVMVPFGILSVFIGPALVFGLLLVC